MIRVEAVLGNVSRGFVPPRGSEVDELPLTRWDAQKRRLRKRTRAGRDVAISLAHAGALRDGDVLYAGADATVIAAVEAGEVLVLTLAPVGSPADLALRALRLGHVLGNQHWPLRLAPHGDLRGGGAGAVDALEIVVPLALDRRVVEAVIRAHRLDGVSYAFRPAAPGEVLDEAPVPPAHQNDHAYAQARVHDHDHGYEHGHAHHAGHSRGATSHGH
jgi:urease accessory protein